MIKDKVAMKAGAAAKNKKKKVPITHVPQKKAAKEEEVPIVSEKKKSKKKQGGMEVSGGDPPKKPKKRKIGEVESDASPRALIVSDKKKSKKKQGGIEVSGGDPSPSAKKPKKRKIEETESDTPPRAKKLKFDEKKKKKKAEEDEEMESPPKKVKKNGENGEKSEVEKKAEREKKKKLKEERRKKDKPKEIYEIGKAAKEIWEEVRREDCPVDKRSKLLAELYETVKGNASKIVFAHDTVRVIECLMMLGSKEIREKLFQEMKGETLIVMAKSKYASFFTIKLLRYGTKEQRAAVFEAMTGKIPELMKHKIANNVVELFYNDYANAVQRNRMLQEFCGPEFRHFKEDDVRTVKDLIAKHPEKERDIKRHLLAYVTTLINKGCYNHSFVHTIIFNFLCVASEKERGEIIHQLREVCVHVLHSHDGTRLSMMALWHGTAKDRKAILKSFKTFVLKIATEEHGHTVLMAAFDCVDDTKLIGKTILTEFIANLKEIAANKYGRKVLIYILAPRQTTYFHPDYLDKLKAGDGNPHSKKDSETRASELLEIISRPALEYLIENLKDLVYDNNSSMMILVSAILNNVNPVSPFFETAMTNLAKEACKKPNIVENTGSHQMLKKIIAYDKIRKEKGHQTIFSKVVLDCMDESAAESWINCNRGTFLFVNMIETGIPEIKELIQEKLKSLSKTLEIQKTKGAEILREKLK